MKVLVKGEPDIALTTADERGIKAYVLAVARGARAGAHSTWLQVSSHQESIVQHWFTETSHTQAGEGFAPGTCLYYRKD